MRGFQGISENEDWRTSPSGKSAIATAGKAKHPIADILQYLKTLHDRILEAFTAEIR
jgi:hypothetical protein